MLIAARLREARALAGLSQGHVAKIMEIHRPAVSEIEAGNRKVSAEEISLFARIYDVEAAWLLGEAFQELGVDNPRLDLAARELSKLNPSDLERMLRLLSAIKSEGSTQE